MAQTEGAKERAIKAAVGKIKRKYPHAKRISVNANEDEIVGTVRVTAQVDGKEIKLDA